MEPGEAKNEAENQDSEKGQRGPEESPQVEIGTATNFAELYAVIEQKGEIAEGQKRYTPTELISEIEWIRNWIDYETSEDWGVKFSKTDLSDKLEVENIYVYLTPWSSKKEVKHVEFT